MGQGASHAVDNCAQQQREMDQPMHTFEVYRPTIITEWRIGPDQSVGVSFALLYARQLCESQVQSANTLPNRNNWNDAASDTSLITEAD
jgi:hypothetical protein